MTTTTSNKNVTLLFSCLFLLIEAASSQYTPLGVPLIDATISFSSVNKTVSYPGVPWVNPWRFPIPGPFDGSPGVENWHSEVGLPQWVKIQLRKPISISQFSFRGKLSFDEKIKGDQRGKTHYRLEAVNPNVAVAGEEPSCTVGWKTLKEDEDADHFTWLGDERTINVDGTGAYSCYRLFFPEVPMDNNCRHFILLSNIEMNYAQKLPAECQEDDKACKCFTESAAFMGPNRKFVSWQMYHDDHNDQRLSYKFPSGGEYVFGFEFKTDRRRPQDGPTTYELRASNPGEEEIVLFSIVGGPPFVSGEEVRQHRFDPPGKKFSTFTLLVKKTGWMQTAGVAGAGGKAGLPVELHGWVQVRDIKFYVTRQHGLNKTTMQLV